MGPIPNHRNLLFLGGPMLPKVILHNALSVDGRNGGFLPA
jgi:hypothetical protein